MDKKKPKQERDMNLIAKSIVDRATEEKPQKKKEKVTDDKSKRPQ